MAQLNENWLNSHSNDVTIYIGWIHVQMEIYELQLKGKPLYN
jgi:hypothetical protein